MCVCVQVLIGVHVLCVSCGVCVLCMEWRCVLYGVCLVLVEYMDGRMGHVYV